MIKVSGLNKLFKTSQVLFDINFQVNKGESIAIIGPSGSGKSTLLRCLNFLETPSSGQIQVGDISIDAANVSAARVHQLRQKIGMVFQAFNLFPQLTAIENLMKGLIVVKGMPKKLARQHALNYLAKVGLTDFADKYPSQLSGGQQQRVAIARALAMQPQVILMDEPTSSLDLELVQEVLNVIKAVTQEEVTTIIVTHELSFARDISDRIMFLDKGRILEFASPEVIFKTTQNQRIQAFFATFRERYF